MHKKYEFRAPGHNVDDFHITNIPQATEPF